ncbi:MAG: outer membrane beta-barrel protein [Ferruginibacter sp.]|nr:outer membrane beta-barrel protein [Ferruginibacter sp.]
MRYKLLASLLLMLLCKWSIAQNVALRINVENEKNEPVVNATAQILRAKDSTLLFVKTLKNDAFFSIQKNTEYFIRITSVNTNLLFQAFFSGERDTVLNIKAQTKSKKLDEVVVTSRTPLVKQEDDKTIIDAEPLASSSTNALEVLEKTPGAIVDQDGNVYLNSATPAAIYLNGRELRMSAQDVASLLKGLPASSISKIEVLRNPSAKYDAASSGGIVNIVLKKGVKLGTNGSLDASYFQGVYATETIGFNVSKSEKKLNTYLSYNFTNRKSFQSLTSVRPTSQIIFIQSFYSTLPAVTNNAGGGFDYQATKKFNIAYDVRFNVNNNRSNVRNDIDIFNTANGIQREKNISLVSNTGPTYFLGNTVSSKYKIDSIGSEWSNSLEYTYFKIDNKQLYDNITVFPAKNTFFGDGTILNKKNIFVLKSDLVLKTKRKVTLETGIKINIARSNNNALYFADSSTGRFVNTYQTNSFKYKENIASVYFQASKTFGGLTVKPGLRLEHTDITGNQIIPTANTFTIKRTDLFPYLFLRHSLGKAIGFKLTGNLIFRRSITRPFYEALNPFPRFVDQYTYDVGNPNLRPQITNNYEFNVSANEFPVLSVGLNDIKNIFTTLTNAKGDTLFRTYDNLGSNKEVYMRLVAGIPPGKNYFFYAGTQMNIINYDGVYNGEKFIYHRTSWNIFMFHNYKATPTLNFTLNGFMRLNGIFNFFEQETLGSLNVSANKSILKKKMSIILSGNDLFRTNIQTFTINVPKFVANGRGVQDTRRVGIALKYNFGLKPRPEKKQGFDMPPEGN